MMKTGVLLRHPHIFKVVMRAFLSVWIRFVVVLAEFASRHCQRLRPSSLGVAGFTCEFQVPGISPVAFNLGEGPSKVKIIFRDANVAFKVFSGMMSIPVAFGAGWMRVEGPIELAVAVTRFFERFEAILFPYPLFPHLYRGKPGVSLRRLLFRIVLYLYAPVALVQTLFRR